MSCNSTTSEPVTKKIKFLSSIENNSCNKDELNGAGSESAQNARHDNNKNKVDFSNSKSDGCSVQVEENENDENLSNGEESDDDSDLFPLPPDDDITDMLEEVEYHGRFPTITQRYFTAYYKLDVQKSANDVCILLHSNRICMLTLAPSHAIFQDGKKIVKVDFRVSEKLDRASNKVSGKGKHGAQSLQSNSNICIISCSNGETYTIKCCMIGKLVEVNVKLLENPELLVEPPHRSGYLAVMLPNIKLLDKMKESLLTQEEYELSIAKRSDGESNLKVQGEVALNDKKQNTEGNRGIQLTSTNETEEMKTDCYVTSKSNNEVIVSAIS